MWHKGTVVIPVHSIDLVGKDIIHIVDADDFAWLCANTVVFVLKKSYYSISAEVAYIFTP